MRTLWLSTGDGENYPLLKQLVPAEKWPAFVDGLVKELEQKPEQIAWIYAQEARWGDLLALVESQLRPEYMLEDYRNPLESRFADEVAILYEAIADTQITGGNRAHYKSAVDYLRRIKMLDKPARVQAIVERMRKQYSQRRALLDELSRL